MSTIFIILLHYIPKPRAASSSVSDAIFPCSTDVMTDTSIPYCRAIAFMLTTPLFHIRCCQSRLTCTWSTRRFTSHGCWHPCRVSQQTAQRHSESVCISIGQPSSLHKYSHRFTCNTPVRNMNPLCLHFFICAIAAQSLCAADFFKILFAFLVQLLQNTTFCHFFIKKAARLHIFKYRFYRT